MKKKRHYLKVLGVFLVALIVFFIVCQFINNPTSPPISQNNSTINTLPSISSMKTTSFNPFLEKSKFIVVKLEGDVILDWANQIEKELKKSDCKGVIAWIESPGGDVAETKLTTHKISVLMKKYNKDLLVYSEKGLYSGAYWIACSANKIIIAPSGEVGSIGVFILRVDETVSDSVAGIKYNLIKSGKNKGMLFSHNKMTDEERKILQGQVDILYDEFIQHIYDCRSNQLTQAYSEIYNQDPNSKKVISYLKGISDGRSYNVTDALWFGLIDNVMYFDDLVYMIYRNMGNVDVVTVDNQKIEDFYPVSEKDSTKIKEKK